MAKQIGVSFSKWQLKRIESLVGDLGDRDVEVVRNIVTMWLYNNPVDNGKPKKKK